MNQKEIFDLEDNNRDRINLLKEGMFWKAYERSAWLFSKEVKTFQVNKKPSKQYGDLISLGFPASVVENMMKGHRLLTDGEAFRSYAALTTVDETDFSRWRSGIPLKEHRTDAAPAHPPAAIPLPSAESLVISALRKFNVMNKTPMECITFITELQEMLH